MSIHHVFELLAHGMTISQVMLMLNQAVENLFLVCLFNLSYFQGSYYAFAVALEGFMEMRISLFVRLLTFGCAVALLWPAPWWVHLAGLLALTGIFVLNWRESRRIPGPIQAQNLNKI